MRVVAWKWRIWAWTKLKKKGAVWKKKKQRKCVCVGRKRPMKQEALRKDCGDGGGAVFSRAWQRLKRSTSHRKSEESGHWNGAKCFFSLSSTCAALPLRFSLPPCSAFSS